jgi:hypothetical protein
LAAVAITLAALLPSAEAACNPTRGFGHFAAPNYAYTFMPATSVNTPASIIGRFWEVGQRAVTNEGGCLDDYWFRPCPATYACGGNPTGKTRYMLGFLGGGNCPNNGCPVSGDLVTLIEDTTTDGKVFFAYARVSRVAADNIQYDYSKVVGTNITLVEMPRPVVTASSRSGTTVNLTLTLNPLNSGFYGLSGQTAQGPGNISGYRIHTFTGTADPGRARSAWVADAVSRPYTGAPVNVGTFPVNCSNTAQDVFVGVSLEFDGGSVTSDYVSGSFRVECDPTIANPKNYRTIEKPADGVKKAPR